MLATSVPPKFSAAFAGSAGSAYRRPIPLASQINVNPGAASLTDGFPPLTFISDDAGGVPPDGRDVNGVLYQTTLWNQWHAAGGPVRYDVNFATAIGGYPAGGLVQSDTGHAVYQSLVDNNTGDPNVGSPNWGLASCVWTTVTFQATGSANVQVVKLAPLPTSLNQLIGVPITIASQGNNTGPVTLNFTGVSGALGAHPVLAEGVVPLSQGTLSTNVPFTVVFNGVTFMLISGVRVFTDAGVGGVFVDGSSNNTAGANIVLRGNGVTTPNKYMRAINGVLQWLNSAYTIVTASLADDGTFQTAGAITAKTGNMTASAGQLIASLGAFESGNPHAGVILQDFIKGSGWSQLPDGLVIQHGSAIIPIDATAHLYSLNKSYISTDYVVLVSTGAFSPLATCQVGAQAFDLISFFMTAINSTNTGSIGVNWLAIGY